MDIENLDEYIQMFYEESVEVKSKGAQSILYLCLSNENMEIMLEHETLFGTVSRTLRDDYKKSVELTLYLLNIFQAYSNFTQFHEFLITVSLLHPYILNSLPQIFRTKSATQPLKLLNMKSKDTSSE